MPACFLLWVLGIQTLILICVLSGLSTESFPLPLNMPFLVINLGVIVLFKMFGAQIVA